MFKRVTIFLYGIVCYAVFFATFLYALSNGTVEAVINPTRQAMLFTSRLQKF